MPLYVLYRTAESQRNPHGAHAALVEAASSAAAPAAAQALVRGSPAGLFDGFAVVEVATTPAGGFLPTYFEGDAVNLRGMSRGGNPA